MFLNKSYGVWCLLWLFCSLNYCSGLLGTISILFLLTAYFIPDCQCTPIIFYKNINGKYILGCTWCENPHVTICTIRTKKKFHKNYFIDKIKTIDTLHQIVYIFCNFIFYKIAFTKLSFIQLLLTLIFMYSLF